MLRQIYAFKELCEKVSILLCMRSRYLGVTATEMEKIDDLTQMIKVHFHLFLLSAKSSEALLVIQNGVCLQPSQEGPIL